MHFFRCVSKKLIFAAFVVAVLVMLNTGHGAWNVYAEGQDRSAQNIVTGCTVTATSYDGETEHLWDGYWGEIFHVKGGGRQSVNVDLNGNKSQGMYIRWAKDSSPWRLEVTLEDGRLYDKDCGNDGFLQEYVSIPEDAVSFRIITDDGNSSPLRIVELEVYSPGRLPESVHIWEPTPSQAEIMFVPTHQDDELLYFGGAIPYYAGELNYDTVVVYTAFDNSLRLHEALEGLWTCGATQYPVFLGYPDIYSESLEEAMKSWDEASVTKSLAELLVHYRPQVVVSHDINGEYGHGQHRMTVHCLRQALSKAEDVEYVSRNFTDMQPWSVSKCYLHLYRKNNISMQWDKMIMESAGGKSSLDIARKAYRCHVSQQKFEYEVSTKAEDYDCRSFGLYRTTVGEDINKNDFFENITLRTVRANPTEPLPDYLERIGSTGWFCRCTDERWLHSEYIRYCTINGATGWYAADSTGIVLDSLQQVQLVMDDITLDLSSYETLTQIKDKPRLYRYSDGIMVENQIVRYCSVGAAEPGFYCADEDGTIPEPAVQVSVSQEKLKKTSDVGMVYVQTWEQATEAKNDYDRDISQNIIILCSTLLVIAALALSVSVIRLSVIRKKRRRRCRR